MNKQLAKLANKLADNYWLGSAKDISAGLHQLGYNCADNETAWAIWRDCILSVQHGQDWQTALRHMATRLEEL